MLWAGGVNRSWTRIVVRMQTDEGIEGIAETCGGDSTLVQLRATQGLLRRRGPVRPRADPEELLVRPDVPGQHAEVRHPGARDRLLGHHGQGRRPAALPAPRRPDARRGSRPSRTCSSASRGPDGRGGERTPEAFIESTSELVEPHRRRDDQDQGRRLRARGRSTTRRSRSGRPSRDHRLRFDPNSLWSVETAIRSARRFEELDLEFYEDPVWGIEGMSRVAAARRHPARDEHVHAPARRDPADDPPRRDRRPAPRPVPTGAGSRPSMKAAATYQVFQIGIGFHSGGEAGISTALQLQLAAALPVLPYADRLALPPPDRRRDHEAVRVRGRLLPAARRPRARRGDRRGRSSHGSRAERERGRPPLLRSTATAPSLRLAGMW